MHKINFLCSAKNFKYYSYLCTLYITIQNARVELITNILIEYLKHNKRIVVPKLGAFIVKQPSGVIVFSDLMRSDDGVLRSLLMAYGVKELEANGMIDRLVFDIHHAINRGESYTIEDFGDFVAGENNTIKFKHKREPQIFGGNIKPPVEILDVERQKLQRETPARQPHTREGKAPQRQRQSATKRHVVDDDDTLRIGKPDAYLRGLKYDKNKNKKRSEERLESKRRRRPSLAVMLLIVIIAAVIIWGGWQWLKSNEGAATTANNNTESTIDALTGADITIDAAQVAEDIPTADENVNNVTK